MEIRSISRKLPDNQYFKGNNNKKIEQIIQNDIDREYYETKIWAYDGYDTDGRIRDYLRQRIEMQALIPNDPPIQNKLPIQDQLSKKSKYYELGKPITGSRSGKRVNICTNLQDMPDFNGVRGKTPLSGKSNVLRWRLGKVKEAGINTIIDLRSQGEVSKHALEACDELGIEYFNFPVEDGNWSKDSVIKIGGFIDKINKGDYYMGCANGEARTDLAVAINYLFNKEAKNLPGFLLDTKKLRGVSIRDNVGSIIHRIQNNPEIIKDWGWENFQDFVKTFETKYAKLSI